MNDYSYATHGELNPDQPGTHIRIRPRTVFVVLKYSPFEYPEVDAVYASEDEARNAVAAIQRSTMLHAEYVAVELREGKA